jgi:SagB-type dehydrogenase family enzyme
MDLKSFSFLYGKVHGSTKKEIMKELALTEEEYQEMEESLSETLQQILQERDRAKTIGPDFVRLTSYLYEDISDQQKGLPHPPAIKARTGEKIVLPAPDSLTMPEITLAQAINQRKSLRKYSNKPLFLQELSFMLWATCWVKEYHSTIYNEFTRRNVPSAGSRHPMECYLLINKVESVQPGLYYYHPLEHTLIKINTTSEITQEIYQACLEQSMVIEDAVTFIFTAVPYRASWRYQQRAYRYLYVDVGHIGQNVHLAAEAIQAGACMIGAFVDEAMNHCLGIDGEEEFVIYIAAVGKK